MTVGNAVFLDFASIHPQDLDVSCLMSVVPDWQWRDDTSLENLTEIVRHADIVVTNKVPMDESVIANAENLKLICVAATGVNNIDVIAAQQQGIKVCNVRAYATPAVVQHVFTLLLSLVTNINRYRKDVISGEWSKSDFFCLLNYPVRELQGKTLGIVGYGELGQAVARVAECFGMHVLIAKRDARDKRAGRVDLTELLAQVDVLSLHCPLTESNRHMIGAVEISKMKDDAILINTARGGLVDEKALLDALINKKLGAAALDVMEQEPPPADNPLLTCRLDNLILTPHTAWASRESRQRLVDELAENILAFQKGKPRNIV